MWVRAGGRIPLQMALVEDRKGSGAGSTTTRGDEKRTSTAVRFLSIDYLGQIICRLRTPPAEAVGSSTAAVTPTTVLDDLPALLDATDAIAVDLLDKTRTSAAALVCSRGSLSGLVRRRLSLTQGGRGLACLPLSRGRTGVRGRGGR